MEGEGKPVIVLASTPLETVPRQLWSHPSVYRSARRRGKPPSRILLDSSIHSQAMKKLAGREWRGRPDIAHITMLTALENPLTLHGHAETLVHTVENRVFKVKPGTRLPRNQQRFTGLIEQLLEKGRVPPQGEPLIVETGEKLEEIVKGRHVVLVDQAEGTPARAASIAEQLLDPKTMLLVPVTPRTRATPELRQLTGGETVKLQGLEEAEPWIVLGAILFLAAERKKLI